MSSLRSVSEHDLTDEVELSNRPVIVDFWADVSNWLHVWGSYRRSIRR